MEPPDPPTTIKTLLSFVTMVGVMDDSGLFPGAIKLATEGGKLNAFDTLGVLKSSISSFNKIPVDSDTTNDPHAKLT